MIYRVLETTYGPAIRFNDWKAEVGELIHTGGILQMPGRPGTPLTRATWKGGAFDETGGDVVLTLTYELDKPVCCVDQNGELPQVDFDPRAGQFAVHLFRSRAEAGFYRPREPVRATGFCFCDHGNGMELRYRDKIVARQPGTPGRLGRPRQLRLATMDDRYAFWLDDVLMAQGEMDWPFNDNEGQVVVTSDGLQARIIEFTEQSIVHEQPPPVWQRKQLLYEEDFSDESLAKNWCSYGTTPIRETGAFIFKFESNYLLKPRFNGPLAVDFTVAPLAAPPWPHLTGGVTDAIFMWMVDQPGGDPFQTLAQASQPNTLKALLPMSLYWMDFGGTNNVTTRLRKHPQRRLIRQFTDRSRLLQSGRSYRITLAQHGDFIEFHVDGQPWVQAGDSHALRTGHIGFRAYMADLKISDLRVWSIQ